MVPPLDGWYLPFSHSTQPLAAGSFEYVPNGQMVHAAEPGDDENQPARHARHVLEPAFVA